MLRADALELLSYDPGAARLAGAVRSFAEVLNDHPGGLREPVGTAKALAQVHCHQYAEWGYDADRVVLGRLGVDTRVLDSSCCGLTGNFGFEAGHYEVSQACAERVRCPLCAKRPKGPTCWPTA